MKQNKNGVVRIPRKCLEEKAKALASQDKWAPFIDILALLIFEVVLFPNIGGLVDIVAIDAFLAFHHSKESPVVAILADIYDTFDRRCEKSSIRTVCCTPALYVWLSSNLFCQEGRHACPLQCHRSCTEIREANWDQLLANIEGASINWFPRWKEGRTGILFSCGEFPNVPLMGTRGCINYNPVLAIRQLGYPMRGASSEESLMPFIARGFSDPNARVLQEVRKAWEMVQRKDKELRGNSNGIISDYRKWLRARTRGLDWLPKLRTARKEEAKAPKESKEVQALKAKLEKAQAVKEKFKSIVVRVQKEYDELKDVNTATGRKNMAETRSGELYGAATASLNSKERKETSRESKAWF